MHDFILAYFTYFTKKDIKESKLSNLEKYTAAYDIVKKYKKYNDISDECDDASIMQLGNNAGEYVSEVLNEYKVDIFKNDNLAERGYKIVNIDSYNEMEAYLEYIIFRPINNSIIEHFF